MESLITILSDFIFVMLDIWVYFWVGIAALFIGVIGVGLWMLRYLPDKHDIISFEMTFSAKKMKGFLTDWYNDDPNKNQIPKVITNTCLDYIWLISYTLVLFSFCAIIAISLRSMDTTLMSAYSAKHFAYLALVAGALDFSENCFLLWLLIKNKNGVNENSVGIIPVMGASIAAVFKESLKN